METTQQMIDWLAANQGKMTPRRSKDIVGMLGMLEAEKERISALYEKAQDLIFGTYQPELEGAKSENERLREALKFYTYCSPLDLIQDGGARARRAMQENKENSDV